MLDYSVQELSKIMHDFMDVKKALKDRYEDQPLKILVCGKTGVGKSTLLNTIIGQELFKIGGPSAISEFTCSTITQHVTPEYASMQNVLVEIFDSPGLQDGTGIMMSNILKTYTKTVKMST